MTTNNKRANSAIKSFFSQSRNIRIVRESVIAGLMTFLMMGLISPFNVEMLGDKRLSYFIAVSIATFVTGILVGLFTTYVLKMPLDAKLPLLTVHRNSVVLFLVNTPVLAVVLTTLNGAYNCNHTCDIWYNNGHFTLVPYTYFLYYIGSSTIFLYIGTYIRNKNWQLRESLQEVRTINKLLEKRQMMLTENVGTKNTHEPPNLGSSTPLIGDKHICHLLGNTNDSRLDIAAEDIIYVESMANYASIRYLQDGVPTQKTLRITLKQIREGAVSK